MADYRVIDADGHVLESVPELSKLLGPLAKRKSLFPRDTFDRNLRGTLGHRPEGAQGQLAGMDQDGIDVMVMYPTMALHIGYVQEEDYAAALADAYNTWLHQFCQADPERLKYVALLPPADPEAAASGLRRAVTELGAVGGLLPTHVPLRPDWGHRYWDPIYAEAERLDVGLSFHSTGLHSAMTDQRFHNFTIAHTIGHPVDQMIALTTVVIGGVLERFQQLRVAFLEGGVGWVPYWIDRMDEEVEKRGAYEAPYLTRKPSEYVRSGRVFFGVECEEQTIPDGVRWGLEDTLLFSSDYPHWDADWPHTVSSLRAREDVSEEVRRKMMHDNALRFYTQLQGDVPANERGAERAGAR